MRLRPVVAHRLPDLVRGELADDVGPENQRDRKRREARQHRSQRDVAEDVEEAYFAGKPLREIEQHQWPPPALPVSAATTRSMRMKRDPLTRRVASRLDTARTALINSSIVAKWRAPLPNPATVSAVWSPSAYRAPIPRSAA